MKPPSFTKIERTFGSLKFAVTIIIIFCAFMIVGTFCESYYGTDFANRLVYKRLPFMLVQILMFLSIVYAVFLRIPFKKRLTGFYIIHTGLIVIGAGSFITYYSGIDGNITLYPKTPTNQIVLSEDRLRIEFTKQGKHVTYLLPYTAFPTYLGEKYQDFHFLSFLPFAEPRLQWTPFKNDTQHEWNSGSYRISNKNVSQEFTLTLHPDANDFRSSVSLGPLQIHYMPQSIASCFEMNSPSKIIIWNADRHSCYTPEEKGISIKKTQSGKRFLVIKENDVYLSFFPEFSPFPMTKDFNIDTKSSIRVISKKLFEEKATLIIFGTRVGFIEDGKWIIQSLVSDKKLPLPWMGFELVLLKTSTDMYPRLVPEYTTPIQQNGTLIKGDQKAIEFTFQGKNYWVTNQRPISVNYSGEKVRIHLEKDTASLPFQISLDRFKMDKDPGSMNPASYESFIKLYQQEGPSEHHVFMNNPLKKSGFTFYQASYFEIEEDVWGSVLSANVDPGRPYKYLGSIFLVLGAIIHYIIRSKSSSKGKEKLA